MILVGSPSKPFEYTAKGTAKRPVVLKIYAAEIEKLYESTDDWQSDMVLPSTWSASESLDFVRAAVTSILSANLSDDMDLFQYGCDRLVIQ